MSDAELLKRIRWYDSTGSPTKIETVRKAKARLKLKGFLDYKSGKGQKVTQYRVISPKMADNSDEVIEAWKAAAGSEPKGAVGFALIELENQFGTDFLLKAISKAQKADKYGQISYVFFKRVFDNMLMRGEAAKPAEAKVKTYAEETEMPPGYEED